MTDRAEAGVTEREAKLDLNDTEFEVVTIASVDGTREDGWHIKRSDGWSFYVPKDSPVEPQVGHEARFYGRGIGYPVRGLVINGIVVFYRTAAEYEEFAANEMYGATINDLLAKWDAGLPIWTIEMGGLGPGYEQCIQVMAVEFARAGKDMPRTDDEKADYASFGVICNAVLAKHPSLGPSGAQYGAAKSLAWHWCFNGGPRAAIEKVDRERRIQASKNFPSIDAARASQPAAAVPRGIYEVPSHTLDASGTCVVCGQHFYAMTAQCSPPPQRNRNDD